MYTVIVLRFWCCSTSSPTATTRVTIRRPTSSSRCRIRPVKIAKNLQQPLTITYWGSADKFKPAQDRLDRYKNLSPKIDVQYMDADKNTQAIAAGVKTLGTIFVDIGTKHQEAKSLTEEEVTGAIVRALKGERLACFVLGSGEHSIDSAERSGYSQARGAARKNNYKTQTPQDARKNRDTEGLHDRHRRGSEARLYSA